MVHGRRLQVTTNLESALRHLRYHENTRILWIDAICINQSDLSERSLQVQHIASIYKSAVMVTLWLGEADNIIATAFDIYQGTVKMLKSAKESESGISLSVLAAAEGFKIQPLAAHTFLLVFRDCTWYTRLWVVQEVLSAEKFRFVSGTRVLTGEDFGLCAREERTVLGLPEIPYVNRYVLWRTYQRVGG
jgi:hypothetical protein